MKVWERMEGKPFKFATCTRILHQVPKFNPMLVEVEEEEEDKKPAANPVGRVMGDTIDRPIGNRKAKKQKLLEKLDMSSVTSSEALQTMAKSSSEMSQIMARRQKHDSLAKRAELYMKLGQEEKALELLAKMEEDDNKPIVSQEEKDLPDNIDVPAAAVAPNQFSAGVDEDTDSDDGNPTLQAACIPALDDGDDGDEDDDEDEDEDSHPSQPSDDSRLEKRTKKTPVQFQDLEK